ncbi:uncharacterized protein LTR77_011108 [Saxophila tyrrhenica]|uniref:Uncharacterized protein n=1 Tax=Saxophila tyrrhenica TaxID=1690608 RepID=A0AAV9NX82_9PEZI|nr:hypothetical protein LTR77_011108 [Saxophila tyrrhenica]
MPPLFRPLALRQPLFTLRPIRTFTTLRPLRIKEDAERSPEEIEKAKQKSMNKPEGSRHTASSGEEAVGADRENVKDHDQHMEELQKQTAGKSQEKHPEGKS